MARSPQTHALHRHADRQQTDRAALDQLLDGELVGTLSTVVDGEPLVVPMLFARDGDRIILHGSTGAGALRQVAAGAPAALCVTALDAIVVASSTFDSSANYRSAVIGGRLEQLDERNGWDALNLLSDKMIPGRVSEVREMTAKERAATLAVALPITDGSWIMKARSGPPSAPSDEGSSADAVSADGAGSDGVSAEGDGGVPWQGVVPLHRTFGEPEPAPWLADTVEVPASVRRLGRVGRSPR